MGSAPRPIKNNPEYHEFAWHSDSDIIIKSKMKRDLNVVITNAY